MMDDDFKLFVRNPYTLYCTRFQTRFVRCHTNHFGGCFVSILQIHQIKNDKMWANVYISNAHTVEFVGKTDLKLRYLISGVFYTVSVTNSPQYKSQREIRSTNLNVRFSSNKLA